MKIVDKHKLVQVKSKFDPNIIRINEVADMTNRRRQYIDKCNLTFGVIVELGVKVIVKDEKYEAFLEKCNEIDKKR